MAGRGRRFVWGGLVSSFVLAGADPATAQDVSLPNSAPSTTTLTSEPLIGPGPKAYLPAELVQTPGSPLSEWIPGLAEDNPLAQAWVKILDRSGRLLTPGSLSETELGEILASGGTFLFGGPWMNALAQWLPVEDREPGLPPGGGLGGGLGGGFSGEVPGGDPLLALRVAPPSDSLEPAAGTLLEVALYRGDGSALLAYEKVSLGAETIPPFAEWGTDVLPIWTDRPAEILPEFPTEFPSDSSSGPGSGPLVPVNQPTEAPPAVPEPGTVALAGLGGVAILTRTLVRRRRGVFGGRSNKSGEPRNEP